jgi:hypothetical protein
MNSEITYSDDSEEKIHGNVFEISASFSPFIPTQTYGPPEGGEIEDIEVKCITPNLSSLEKFFMVIDFNKLLDTNDKFREKIETLLFDNIDYPEPDEDWYL